MAIQISGNTVINDSRQLASGLTSAYDAVDVSSSNATVVNRTYRVLTDDSNTITLPASPGVGNEVCIAVQGKFKNNIVARNGQKIMGLNENIQLDIAYAAVTFVYTGTTVGWRIS